MGRGKGGKGGKGGGVDDLEGGVVLLTDSTEGLSEAGRVVGGGGGGGSGEGKTKPMRWVADAKASSSRTVQRRVPLADLAKDAHSRCAART